MASSFHSLCDDRNSARLKRLIDVRQTLHLADQLGTATVNALGERARIAEREKYAKGCMAEGLIELAWRAG